MITFDKEHYNKFQDFTVNGTGYLAYRDIKKVVDLYQINLEKVLDLGSASGRSTKFLTAIAKSIYACDASSDAIDFVRKNVTENVFINDVQNDSYQHFPYSSIFSFFTFLHLTSEEEILSELARCSNSLVQGGYLVIVTGHKNLFYKNYSSVGCIGDKPNDDGHITKVQLKKINCEVDNCFWEYSTLIKLAQQNNFDLAGVHLPVGEKTDNKEYIDEYKFSPYVYLIFRKQ